jgi:hypothetical protein
MVARLFMTAAKSYRRQRDDDWLLPSSRHLARRLVNVQIGHAPLIGVFKFEAELPPLNSDARKHPVVTGCRRPSADGEGAETNPY